MLILMSFNLNIIKFKFVHDGLVIEKILRRD